MGRYPALHLVRMTEATNGWGPPSSDAEPPMWDIGSAASVPSAEEPAPIEESSDALAVLDRYRIEVPAAVRAALEAGGPYELGR